MNKSGNSVFLENFKRMTTPGILQKKIGFSNVALIVNGANSILVDTGVRGGMKKLRILFREAGIAAEDIRLIILTHTHYDHTGNLQKMVKLSGAKVLVHKNEFENLKTGFTPIPDGQGKYSGFITRLGKKVYPSYASPRAFTADLINSGEFDLKEYSIDGKVISTPGHTSGSQSVLLGDQLIAGDTFLNLNNGRIFPPFVNEPRLLLETWKKLFQLKIKTVYPGHGKRFNIEKAYSDYERWKKKLEN